MVELGKRKLGRVLVTGADGFIGSHLVENLLERSCEVTALCLYNSNGSFGWLDSIAAAKPDNLNLVLGDIRDGSFLRRTFEKQDTVFHLASLIAIPYSYVAPQSYVETNVTGTLNVAQACLDNGVGRLVHTSTSEVYGTAITVPISEAHPLQGQSPYSATKIGADMIVNSFYRSFRLPAVTLRPFNTYGPRQSRRAIIPTVAFQIVAGKTEIRAGNLTPTRDFNYVGDTVAAFLALAESPEVQILGETYNAGSGREISIENLILLIAEIVGRKVTIVSEESRLRPEKSEVERLLADASKLTAVTGWKPETSLEDGLRRVCDWVKLKAANGRSVEYQI